MRANAWRRYQIERFPYYWPLWGECTGYRWFPVTKGKQCGAGALMFSLPLDWKAIKQTVELPVMWDAIGLTWRRVITYPSKVGRLTHYTDVIMDTMRSQIFSLTIVYSNVYSDADQRKHQSSASLAFVRGIHRRPVNSPHKWPVTRKMFPFDDVIMRKVMSHRHTGRQ